MIGEQGELQFLVGEIHVGNLEHLEQRFCSQKWGQMDFFHPQGGAPMHERTSETDGERWAGIFLEAKL